MKTDGQRDKITCPKSLNKFLSDSPDLYHQAISLCIQIFVFAFLHLPFPQFGSFSFSFLKSLSKPVLHTTAQVFLWQSWPPALPSASYQFLVLEGEGRDRWWRAVEMEIRRKAMREVRRWEVGNWRGKLETPILFLPFLKIIQPNLTSESKKGIWARWGMKRCLEDAPSPRNGTSTHQSQNPGFAGAEVKDHCPFI